MNLRYPLAGIALSIFLTATAAHASSWSPALLVNTESFQIIDEGDSSTDVEIRFGDTLNEILYWDRSNSRFRFSDDLHIDGNLSATGTLAVTGAATLNGATTINNTLDTTGSITTDANLTINEDNGAADAVLTFGNDAGTETITFSDTTNRFEFSDDLHATGNLSASGTFAVTGTTKLQGATTINGATAINSTLDTTGNITTDANLTINEDNGAADAVLTFGNDAGTETITFSDTTNKFEFSDDIAVTGNISGSSLTIDGSSVNINGVAYSFTGTQGGGGTFLQNDGAGNLTWTNSSVGDGSGSIVFLSPEYPSSMYFSSGSTSIGVLSASGGLADGNDNYYVWNSSKSAIQDYWIGVRVRVPDNFGSWDPVAPIQFRYKTTNASSAVNHMNIKLLDTGNTEIGLTGGNNLANTSWTTASITGPESTGTYSVGGYITIFVKLATTSSGTAKAGFLQLNWETSTP